MPLQLSTPETEILRSNILKIDPRYKEIATLLQFTSGLSVESLNCLLQPVYESLLMSGIISSDGSINEQEVFSIGSRLPHHMVGDSEVLHPYYSMDYNPESEYGIMSWNGHICFHEFQIANENFINFAKQCNMKKMIRDTEHFTILSPQSRRWFTEYLIPQFCAAGIKYSAVITPKNNLSRKIVEEIINETTVDTLDVRLFPTIDEATSWIKTV